MTPTEKQQSLDILTRRYGEQKAQVTAIDTRLAEYFDGLIAEPEYHCGDELLEAGMRGNWNRHKDCYSAPTQSVLQRWLREVKIIIVLVDYNEDDDCEENERYGITVYIGNKRYVELATYPTYEAALEAGLQKCLTIIIDNDEN